MILGNKTKEPGGIRKLGPKPRTPGANGNNPGTRFVIWTPNRTKVGTGIHEQIGGMKIGTKVVGISPTARTNTLPALIEKVPSILHT